MNNGMNFFVEYGDVVKLLITEVLVITIWIGIAIYYQKIHQHLYCKNSFPKLYSLVQKDTSIVNALIVYYSYQKTGLSLSEYLKQFINYLNIKNDINKKELGEIVNFSREYQNNFMAFDGVPNDILRIFSNIEKSYSNKERIKELLLQLGTITSEREHKYWNTKRYFYYSVIISIVCAILPFVM